MKRFRAAYVPRLVLMGLLLQMGAANVTEWVHKTPCLNTLRQPDPANLRVLKYPDGSLNPVKVPYENSGSGRILGEIAYILLGEVMGYYAVIADPHTLFTAEIINYVAGCLDPDDHTCARRDLDHPPLHMSFETWVNGIIRAERTLPPDARPTLISLLDYTLSDEFFIWQDTLNKGLKGPEHSWLTFFGYYNANYYKPHQYFDPFEKMLELVPEEIRVRCSVIFSSGYQQSTHTDVYFQYSNDSVTFCAYNDTVWFSLACRKNVSECVPLMVMYNFDFALQITYFTNMPVALIMVDSNVDINYVQYFNAVRGGKFLFHWYTPDDSLVDENGLLPVILNFPKQNVQQQSAGLYKTGKADFNPRNYAWSQLKDVDVRITFFAAQLNFHDQDMNVLMQQSNYLKSQGTSDVDAAREIACNWVKDNEATWTAWIPAKCPAALYADASLTRCRVCSAGSYCAGGIEPMITCPVNHYCPFNVSAPIACPSKLLTASSGSNSLSHCALCGSGYTLIGGGCVPSSTSAPLALVIGISVAAFVFFWVVAVAGFYVWRKWRVQSANAAFLAAFRSAKAGDTATSQSLPFELRKRYDGHVVLGRGAFGCVLEAKTKQGNHRVAMPDKGCFTDREVRQLRREASVLELFTALKCEHSVQLTGVESVRINANVCWFVMELLQGENMETILYDKNKGPISDVECMKLARNVLAALKVMHSDGIVHRDIKPANVVRCKDEGFGRTWDGQSYTYKLVDFGTALGIDDVIAKEAMMTLASSRQMGAGTLPYMSPEMFKEPEHASYATDQWSLGVTMFELVTGRLPFEADSDLLLSLAVAGNMSERSPTVLDKLPEDKRATFDSNFARVIAQAMEKWPEDRFESVDEMHEALYCCLIDRNEACYSLFVSYRVASEEPFARLLFDELNHSVTPGGHRVTVYLDAHRLVKGEDWEKNFAMGLLNSLCFFPLLSYGATAPLADFAEAERAISIAKGWEEMPCGRMRLTGSPTDAEDNVLKEFLIAEALLDRRVAIDSGASVRDNDEAGLLQLVYPILIGRQEPKAHPDYPGMGTFFSVQAGGGKYPTQPSPATNAAVVRFLRETACLPDAVVQATASKSVLACMHGLTALQGCQMWNHPKDLAPVELSKEQRALVGKGYTGPPVSLEGVELTDEQRRRCGEGFDEQQLCMLKAQIRHKRSFFHEIIDRAIDACAQAEALEEPDPADQDSSRQGTSRQGSSRQVTRTSLAFFQPRRLTGSSFKRISRNRTSKMSSAVVNSQNPVVEGHVVYAQARHAQDLASEEPCSF